MLLETELKTYEQHLSVFFLNAGTFPLSLLSIR